MDLKKGDELFYKNEWMKVLNVNEDGEVTIQDGVKFTVEADEILNIADGKVVERDGNVRDIESKPVGVETFEFGEPVETEKVELGAFRKETIDPELSQLTDEEFDVEFDKAEQKVVEMERQWDKDLSLEDDPNFRSKLAGLQDRLTQYENEEYRRKIEANSAGDLALEFMSLTDYNKMKWLMWYEEVNKSGKMDEVLKLLSKTSKRDRSQAEVIESKLKEMAELAETYGRKKAEKIPKKRRLGERKKELFDEIDEFAKAKTLSSHILKTFKKHKSPSTKGMLAENHARNEAEVVSKLIEQGDITPKKAVDRLEKAMNDAEKFATKKRRLGQRQEETLFDVSPEGELDLGETFATKRIPKQDATEANGYDDIPTTVEAAEEFEGDPVSTQEVYDTMEELWDIPIREGRVQVPRALGIYKRHPQVARIKGTVYGNIAVAAHEVAHHIDIPQGISKGLPADVQSEVKQLDYEPDKGRVTEGFAEFVRLYLTTDTAKKRAPKTYDWLEGHLIDNPEIADKMERTKAIFDD